MVTIQHYLGSARSNLFRITLSYLDFLLLLLSCCCSAAQLCLTLCDPMVVGTFKYILYSKFLSDIWFAKYFLSFCKCLLTLLIFFFPVRSFLDWCNFICLSLFLLFVLLVLCSRNHWRDWCHEAFPCFLLGVLQVWVSYLSL